MADQVNRLEEELEVLRKTLERGQKGGRSILDLDLVERTYVTAEELGFTDEEWRLLDDADKEKALEEWWFNRYSTIWPEVIE